MFWPQSWLTRRPIRDSRSCPRREPRPHQVGLYVEVLEDRCVPSAYTMTDLGGFSPSAINNAGQIAGTANGNAALWQNGVITDLGTLGGASSGANDINDAGQVAGFAGTTDGNYHAALWQNGTITDLGTLSAGLHSVATGINNLGQVVGWADVYDSSSAKYYPHAFRWDSSTGMQDMGTFGGNWAKAVAINDSGQIVGTAFIRGFPAFPYVNAEHAFIWTPGVGTQFLGQLASDRASEATDINDAGQVVGTSGIIGPDPPSEMRSPSYYIAHQDFLWQNGAMAGLGFNSYYAGNTNILRHVAINNNSQVVGGNYLWQSGALINLNNLLEPDAGGIITTSPGLNDGGQIVGQGTLGGQTDDYLLSPPDPGQVISISVSDFPSLAISGAAGSITVTVRNALNAPPSGCTCTVHFTSSDIQAVLPDDYSFTASDGGVQTFHATLNTVGLQSITATDAVAGITGSQGAILVKPVSLSVTGFPATITAGTYGSFTVTALDALGRIATGYTGTVDFTSSDPQAWLPNYTFTAADMGAHTFSTALATAGLQSITASDLAVPGVLGSEGNILVTPAAASRFVISGPSTITAGTSFSITVTAYDSYGNVATGYADSVGFKSSDSRASIPGKYKFTTGSGGDNGVHTFSGLVLKKKGTQTITVFDTLTSGIMGSFSVNVI